MLIALLSRIRL